MTTTCRPTSPYTKKGQELFDKAVTCDGKTITYRFKKAWPDFPLSIAQLRYMDPYREDLDKGDANNFAIISNGPYKLDGAWKEGTGGKFVRNENWDASSDPIRKAFPDTWDFREGDTDEAIYEQLLADSGDAQYAVTERRLPPACSAARTRRATATRRSSRRTSTTCCRTSTPRSSRTRTAARR